MHLDTDVACTYISRHIYHLLFTIIYKNTPRTCIHQDAGPDPRNTRTLDADLEVRAAHAFGQVCKQIWPERVDRLHLVVGQNLKHVLELVEE